MIGLTTRPVNPLATKSKDNDQSNVSPTNGSVAVEIVDKTESVVSPAPQNITKDNENSSAKTGKKKSKKSANKEKIFYGLTDEEKTQEVRWKLTATGVEYMMSKTFDCNLTDKDKNKDYLGSGGFADVFRCRIKKKSYAYKRHKDKKYALKRMKFVYEQYTGKSSFADIMSEIQIHAKVRTHKNVVDLVACSNNSKAESANTNCNCLNCTVGIRFIIVILKLNITRKKS